MTAVLFTRLFIAVLLLGFALKLWLSFRQIRHVSQHRAAVPLAFGDRISLTSHQKAADYTLAKQRLGILALVVETVLLLAFTLLGGLQALFDVSQGFGGYFWAGIGFIVLVMVVSALVDLPFDLYRQFVLEERFGFNRMSFATWLKDGVTGLAVSAVLGLPLLAAVLYLMRSAGENWWLWAWALWVGFSLLVMLIFPTWIAPLFNKFVPMQEGSTRSRVEALLTRCGFASNGLFVMDGSKRSNHGNAYFTGLGKRKRIVFFDTLLSRLNDQEVEAVLAHELGHFKHKHIAKRLVLSIALSLLGFALLGWLIQKPWFFQGLGMTPDLNQAQAAALVLFMLALPVFMFPIQPLSSYFSRKDEFQADQFAAANSNAQDLVKALVKLYDDNSSSLTPDPLHSAFYDSHPPAAVRIANLLHPS